MRGVIVYLIGLVCGMVAMAGILLVWFMYELAKDLPH